MSEEKRIQQLLSALEERMQKGEISRSNYEHLKHKYENRLTNLPAGTARSVSPSGVPSEDAIFEQVLKKVVTRVYACDYCGGALDVAEGRGNAKCSFCGYVNEVDYLRRVSEHLRAERVQIIKGAIDSFAKVTNLEQLKLPLHEKFLATAHIYENRALRLEHDLGKIYEYADGSYQEEKDRFLKIEDSKQHYEASKSWHQVAELYRNAAEFAPNSFEQTQDLAASHYYDGLAFLNVSFAPLRLVKNTFQVTVTAAYYETAPWPWGKIKRGGYGRKTCKTLWDLIIAQYWVESGDRNRVEHAIMKYAHPILIRPEARDAALLSALKATNCFLRAYEISKEESHLVYALVSKLLTYILYVERLREHFVGPQVFRNIEKICFKELYAPSSNQELGRINELSLKHANSLRSIAKKFALFAIATFKNYRVGFHTEWLTRADIESRSIGYGWWHLLGYDHVPLLMNKAINKIDQVFNHTTASLHLWMKRPTIKAIGFKFSWILGRYKTGLFSYNEPSVYLAIEAATHKYEKEKKGTVTSESFFERYFNVFQRLAVCPELITASVHKGKHSRKEITLRISSIALAPKNYWEFDFSVKEFVDLYYSLCSSFTKINHTAAQALRKKYSDRIQLVKMYEKRTKEIAKRGTPRILKGANSQALTPEFINYDLAFLSFFADVLQEFPTLDKDN